MLVVKIFVLCSSLNSSKPIIYQRYFILYAQYCHHLQNLSRWIKLNWPVLSVSFPCCVLAKSGQNIMNNILGPSLEFNHNHAQQNFSHTSDVVLKTDFGLNDLFLKILVLTWAVENIF